MIRNQALCDPYSVVSQYIEDVAQENQWASSESVQILSVGHLQGFPEEASATQTYTDAFKCVQDEPPGVCKWNTLSFTILGLIIASLKEWQKSPDVEGGSAEAVGAAKHNKNKYL